MTLPEIHKGKVSDIGNYSFAPIFDSIRLQYPYHDIWWNNVYNRTCWYLIEDSELIAIAIIKIEPKNECNLTIDNDKILKICLFKVLETHWNSGIGNLLIKAIIEFANENSLKKIYVTTNTSNQFAIGFFEHMDFQRVYSDENNETYFLKTINHGNENE